jgi:iron complex outermembrane receptor protein
VHATAGVKLESNVYTGWEVLPSARLAWKPHEGHLAWGALSRAVRAPARLDRDFFLPGNPPFLINGGPDFESEVADVVELGYRATLSPTTTFSVTAFHSAYDKLRSGQRPPAVIQNMIEGTTSGLEMWGGWQAMSGWRLTAGFTLLDQDLRVRPGSTDPTGPSALGNDPRYQGMLRSSMTFARGVELDIIVRHVAALPSPAVPAYTAVDARLGWRVRPGLEVALSVQNAGGPGHAEFNASATAARMTRAAYVKVTWRP